MMVVVYVCSLLLLDVKKLGIDEAIGRASIVAIYDINTTFVYIYCAIRMSFPFHFQADRRLI